MTEQLWSDDRIDNVVGQETNGLMAIEAYVIAIDLIRLVRNDYEARITELREKQLAYSTVTAARIAELERESGNAKSDMESIMHCDDIYIADLRKRTADRDARIAELEADVKRWSDEATERGNHYLRARAQLYKLEATMKWVPLDAGESIKCGCANYCDAFIRYEGGGWVSGQGREGQWMQVSLGNLRICRPVETHQESEEE